MDLFTKQKQMHRHKKKLMVTKGERGKEYIWSMGLTDAQYCTQNKQQGFTI